MSRSSASIAIASGSSPTTRSATRTVFEALGSVPIDVAAVAAVAAVGMTVARAMKETDLARKWKTDSRETTSVSRAWAYGQACAVADAATWLHQALAVKG